MDAIMVYIWLGVVVVALVGEAISMDMTSIWFAVGGVCSIISWFIWNSGVNSIILQAVIFVVVSLICIATLRKVCKKFISRKDNEKTNLDAETGERTRLLTEICYDKKGTIKLKDVVWNCVSEDGERIDAGALVEVVKISGNKMIVRKIEDAPKPLEAEKIVAIVTAAETKKKTATKTGPKTASKTKTGTKTSQKSTTRSSKSTKKEND